MEHAIHNEKLGTFAPGINKKEEIIPLNWLTQEYNIWILNPNTTWTNVNITAKSKLRI